MTDPTRTGDWVEETLRYDTSSQILARTVTADFQIARPAPSRPATGCCCSSGRPTATRAVFAGSGPFTTSIATPRSSSASAPAGTTASARTWPGSKPGSRSSEFARRVSGYDIDEAARRAGPLGRTSAASRPADDGQRALTMPDSSRTRSADRGGHWRVFRASAPPPRSRSPPTVTRSRSAPAAPPSASELAASIRAGGGEAIAVPLDVAEDESVQGFAAAGRPARSGSRS